MVLGTLTLIAGASELTRAGYSVDEEFTVFAVRGIQAHGLPLLPSGLLYDRGLAYSYAGWLASAVTGAELPAFRALSLLCAIASIYLTFRIVRRHTTERAAWLAALLVSVFLPFWATATSGRFYAPFMASYLGVLFLLGGQGWSYLGALVAVSLVSRLTHELAFTLAAVPALCLLLDDRTQRRRWLMSTVAVVTGLVAAQALLFVLHYLAPSSGETMVRRFFLWQVLNLFEVPGPRQYGVVLTAMVAGWLLLPRRAGVITMLGLSGTAMVLSFSLARATNAGPLTAALVRAVLWDGAQYPLDMFLHIAAAHPATTALALGGLVARLTGAGGEWRLPERGVHLAWIGWVVWFGAIDSGITINYLLLPMSLMLAAVAIDVDAIVSHGLPPVSTASRRVAVAVVMLTVVGLGADQWRGTGSVVERLEAARPTIQIDGINDVRASLLPSDRVACTDELACLLLVGRIDRWLAVDDFVRERFLVTRADGALAGVYTGAPAVFRPGDLFTPNADGTLPDRVLIVDVFKEYPIGNSRSWVPRAIELDGLQVTPLLETPQARVVQISPAERNAAAQLSAVTRNRPPMPKIYLIEGPVGAGKSTFAASLAKRVGGVHIALDEWFARLFSPDRPSTDIMSWYLERKERLLDHIWNHAQAVLACGTPPVLELGLVQRRSREDFYQRAAEAGVELAPYLLVASREVRRERVMRRNVEKGPTFSMVVPAPFFEMASDSWEEPDELEIADNRIERISTEG